MSAFAAVVRAEAFKLLRKRRLYVLAGLYWVFLPAVVLFVAAAVQANAAGSFVDTNDSVGSVLREVAGPFGLARLLLVAPTFMNPTPYLIALTLLAALLIGDERSSGMWKNVLVIQPNRLAVLGGKVAVAMLAMLVLVMGGMLFGFLFGLVGTLFLPTMTLGGAWLDLFLAYALQWAFLLTPTLLAFLLIFVVRSGVLGVVLVLFLPPLLEGVYSLVTLISQVQPLNQINAFFQAVRLKGLWDSLPKYFLNANLYVPAREPAKGIVSSVGQEAAEALSSLGLLRDTSLAHSALVMLGYAALFSLLLVWAFLRRDHD